MALQEKILSAYAQFKFQNIYQWIHNFCSVEMGSFYLDIIKDRQYTSKKSGIARRSSQTAMYYILEALTRWLAPILSFTAEEIWQHMSGDREASVFLSAWFDDFPVFEKEADTMDWSSLIALRDAVNKVLEAHRKAGRIRSALDADVYLYADNAAFSNIAVLKNELRFLLITSGASLYKLEDKPESAEATDIEGVHIDVVVSENAKCERCWQRREDVGQHNVHATICVRCIDNIEGEGEVRRYA